VEVTGKTLAYLMSAVLFVCWPAGNQHAEDVAPQEKAAGPEIPWWCVAGGSGSSTGGAYEIQATVGQAASGEAAGGSYYLTAGYLAVGVTPIATEIFSDGFESGDTLEWSSTTGL